MSNKNLEYYKSLKEVDVRKLASALSDTVRTTGIKFKYGIAFLAYMTHKGKTLEKVEKDGLVKKYLDEVKENLKPELLEKLVDSFTSEEFESYLVTYDQDNDFRENGVENSTPDSLIRLALELLDIQDEEEVVDLGSGVGNFLTLASMINPKAKYSGIEISAENFVTAMLKAYVTKQDINYQMGNMFGRTTKTYDKVFNQFPMGLRMADVRHQIDSSELAVLIKEANKIASAEWMSVLSLLTHLNDSGRGISLVRSNSLLHHGDRFVRHFLLKRNYLEGIINLPEQLLPYTNQPISILLLKKDSKKVNMVDATDLFTRDRWRNTLTDDNIKAIVERYQEKKCLIDFTNNYIDEDNLHPKRYIGEEYNKNSSLTMNDAIKEVTRGPALKKQELENLSIAKESETQYMQIRDIGDRGQINDDMGFLEELPLEYAPSILKDNSLLLSRTAPFKCGIYRKKNNIDVIPTNNLYIFEVNTDKFDPVFIAMYLNSVQGQDQLGRIASDGPISNISLSHLKKLSLPEIPLQKQKDLANKFLEIENQINLLEIQKDILESRQKEVIEEVL